mgnify:CR=1 FL=1
MKSPIKKLVKNLKKDEGYYTAWKANIAMAFSDAYNSKKKTKKHLNKNDIHVISNEAADNFLSLLMKK